MALLDAAEELIMAHPGKRNAISSKEISEELGGLDTLDSTPATRKVMRRLIKKRGVLVGACSKGYFLIETQDELNDYLDNLAHREGQIRERREALRRLAERDGLAIQHSLGDFGNMAVSD